MNPKLIATEDGSHTLESVQFGVTYHSIHGAIQETQTVFIDAGLQYKGQSCTDLAILDIGFGTGLNALMTFLYAAANQLTISYVGVEAYPIEMQVVKSLNYDELLTLDATTAAAFIQMHQKQDETIALSPTFQFTKQVQLFQDIEANNEFDIIYFDAFAPTAQPELWEIELLTKMYQALKPNGVLCTYCAKGAFKRTLKQIGFAVEALPGPKGKREMTRAIKV